MGLFCRRSFKLGPLRTNLSKCQRRREGRPRGCGREVKRLRGRWPRRRLRQTLGSAMRRSRRTSPPSGSPTTPGPGPTRTAGLTDFHFHDLRHHFASWFTMRAGDLLALQKILGHRTLALTRKSAHPSPAYLQSAMEKASRRGDAITEALSASSAQSAVESPERAVSS
jgi:integrase